MINSIQYFQEKWEKKSTEIFSDYSETGHRCSLPIYFRQ